MAKELKKRLIDTIYGYTISVEPLNFIVSKGKTKKQTYHNTLQDAILEVFYRTECDSLLECKGLKDALDRIEANNKNMQEYINKLIK